MDGAAHLYNSNIIIDLLFDKSSIYHEFFELNSQLVPNWLGHVVLTVFNAFLPAWMAEKILLLSYSFLLPYSFRYLVKSYKPDSLWLTCLVFPFVYHFLFCLGYYNFSLSFILAFYIMGFITTHFDQPKNRKYYLTTFILLSLLALCHIFGFVLLLLIVSLYFLWHFFMLTASKTVNYKEFSSILKKVFLFILSALPGLLIVGWHILLHSSTSGSNSATKSFEVGKYLSSIRPIICYNMSFESKYTGKMFYILFALTTICLYKNIKQLFSHGKKVNWNNVFEKKNFWFFFGLIMLMILSFSPNFIAGAGNVSNRFGLVFFFALIIWLSINNLPKWLKIAGFISFLIFHCCLIVYYIEVNNDLNKDAKMINDVIEKIEDNSTVYTINTSDHWLKIHFNNYLAIDNPVFVNDNYEASVKYFPVRWKDSAKKITLRDRKSVV